MEVHKYPLAHVKLKPSSVWSVKFLLSQLTQKLTEIVRGIKRFGQVAHWFSLVIVEKHAEETTYITNVFASFVNWIYPTGRDLLCSLRSKLFPCLVDPIAQGALSTRKQTGSHRSANSMRKRFGSRMGWGHR